ncbi:MAG TPA: fatty acid desaturase [Isosphaeraceae bacterium]|jgi:fatty acid desaturase|nr:fatty acid desaturase [Isosphaeraceae bacterium]
MIPETRPRPRFDAPALRDRIRPLRDVDNVTNLGYLALEYLGMIAVIAVAVTFAEYRGTLGLAWAWNVPVFAAAIALVGGFQHRLAGLGHESSHYTLLMNKYWNDLVADLFCMFPLLTTMHFYRLFHLAHHQYTNDPAHDPDLVNMGRSKQVGDFPMSRARFVALFYLRGLTAPASFLRYQWDYIYVNVLGKGNNVYMRRVPGGDAADPRPRAGTVLGLAYILGFNALLFALTGLGRHAWLAPAAAIGVAVVAAGAAVVPGRWLFQSPFRQPYSSRSAGVIRLSYYTILLAGLAHLRWATGGRSVVYIWLLWLVPMMTTFMFYMLLRDVYQHANADDGRLTNSRVFFADPFTRWAVFVYGQDVHVTHHLFPAVPHYRLRELHSLLRREHPDYAAAVVECHGTFANAKGRPTILDELTKK